MTVKHPAGINPMQYWDYIGKAAVNDLDEDRVHLSLQRRKALLVQAVTPGSDKLH